MVFVWNHVCCWIYKNYVSHTDRFVLWCGNSSFLCISHLQVEELCDSTFHLTSSQVCSELQRSGQITNESVYSVFSISTYLANLGNIWSYFDITQSGHDKLAWGNIFSCVCHPNFKNQFYPFHHQGFSIIVLKKVREGKHEARTRLYPSDLKLLKLPLSPPPPQKIVLSSLYKEKEFSIPEEATKTSLPCYEYFLHSKGRKRAVVFFFHWSV